MRKNVIEIGRLVATRGVADLMDEHPDFAAHVAGAFQRYVEGDWGDLCPEDWEQNDEAVQNSEDRILAAYDHPQHDEWRIWIITESDRSVTTILFPHEYYPKSYQEKVYELNLIDRETVKKKRKIFMTAFYVIMTIALLLMIGLWNRANTFSSAYWQALLFLEVMNWYDGIIIDRLWVGHSPFWNIPGVALPYVQTWKQVIKKRGILTLIWLAGAAVVAGLVVLVF